MFRPSGDFVPGYEASGWQGLGAPKNTPFEIIDKLNKETNAGSPIRHSEPGSSILAAMPFATSPAEFSQFIAEFTEKWGKVIRCGRHQAE